MSWVMVVVVGEIPSCVQEEKEMNNGDLSGFFFWKEIPTSQEYLEEATT